MRVYQKRMERGKDGGLSIDEIILTMDWLLLKLLEKSITSAFCVW